MNQENFRDSQAEIPQWKCERFVLNELDEAEMEEIRLAAADNEHLRSRLAAIEQSNHEILEEYPPGWMSRQIRQKLGNDASAAAATKRHRRPWFTRTTLVPAGFVAVIALAILVLPNLIPNGTRDGSEVTRFKGASPQLHAYRKTASGSDQLSDGDFAAEHDLILLQYQTNDLAFGAILSVDGRGNITRHLPMSGGQAVTLELQKPHFLEFAYELDDAPHWEMFVFVTSPGAFPIDAVVQAILQSLSLAPSADSSGVRPDPPRDLPLPEGLHVSTFTLNKDTPDEE